MAWLVSIVNHAAPVRSAVTPAVQARKDALLALWSVHIAPVAEGGDGDIEDFYEQAARLEAALETFGAENVWLVISTDIDTAVNAGTGERCPAESLEHLPRYGTQPSRHHQSVDQPQAYLADDYHRYDAFLSRAGRRMTVCGFLPEDERATSLGEVLTGFAAGGIRRAMLKTMLKKYAIFPVDLHEGFVPADATRVVFDALNYGAMYLEGGAANIMAQEFVTMEYEYRVFVVGQRAVAAAGCIEEFTPLDNNGDAFDNQLRRNRQERTPVEVAPEIAEVLTGFARSAVEDLAKEVPELTEYVIDVAMGADGQPLIVELNPLLNSGLYASRPDLVTAAMAADARDRVPA